jgi:DNA (cytosine-5)-methyltransferase 1
MRHGSLESGIGMFDYASEMMGWENVFHCEISPFCRTVLNYYWPKAKSYANVFGFNGNKWRGKVDIISAGFPCQPFSNAGKRKGSTDDRHIWPENMRIFREAQPAFIVCENVPGLVTIEDGMVFEQVCLDLENEGYEVQTFIIPAVATDKDHRRDRIWIVAYNSSYGRIQYRGTIHNSEWNNKEQEQGRQQQPNGIRGCNEQSFINASNTDNFRCNGGADNRSERHIQTTEKRFLQEDKPERGGREFGFGQDNTVFTDTLNQGLQGSEWSGSFQGGRKIAYGATSQFFRNTSRKEKWIEAATRLCTLDDGSAGGLDLTAISKIKWRTESLKAAGNTIVWEIAFEIFKAIEQTEKLFTE